MKNEDKILELLSDLVKHVDRQDTILENQGKILEKNTEILDMQTKKLELHSNVLEHMWKEQQSTNTKLDKISNQIGDLTHLLKEEVFRRLSDLENRMAAVERK